MSFYKVRLEVGMIVRHRTEYKRIVGFRHMHSDHHVCRDWVVLRPLDHVGPTERCYYPSWELSPDTTPCAQCDAWCLSDFLCPDCRKTEER